MRKLAIASCIGFALALGIVTAPLPVAVAAGLPVKCSNKTLKLTTEESPPRHFSEPVKSVRASAGFSCAKAYEIVRAALTGNLPRGWKLGTGQFQAPAGFVPELASKGSKRVQFAVHGG
jgi:hypothetical protein